MGNSLPKNPTHSQYVIYFSKLRNPKQKIWELLDRAKLFKNLDDIIFFLIEYISYQDNLAQKMFLCIDLAKYYRSNGQDDMFVTMLKYVDDCLEDMEHSHKMLAIQRLCNIYSEFDIVTALNYYDKNNSMDGTILARMCMKRKLYGEAAIIYQNQAKALKSTDRYVYKTTLLFIAGLCKILNGEDIEGDVYHDMVYKYYKSLVDISISVKTNDFPKFKSTISPPIYVELQGYLFRALKNKYFSNN